LGRKTKAEKFTILSEAIALITALRDENKELRGEKVELSSELTKLSSCLQTAFPEQPDFNPSSGSNSANASPTPVIDGHDGATTGATVGHHHSNGHSDSQGSTRPSSPDSVEFPSSSSSSTNSLPISSLSSYQSPSAIAAAIAAGLTYPTSSYGSNNNSQQYYPAYGNSSGGGGMPSSMAHASSSSSAASASMSYMPSSMSSTSYGYGMPASLSSATATGGAGGSGGGNGGYSLMPPPSSSMTSSGQGPKLSPVPMPVSPLPASPLHQSLETTMDGMIPFYGTSLTDHHSIDAIYHSHPAPHAPLPLVPLPHMDQFDTLDVHIPKLPNYPMNMTMNGSSHMMNGMSHLSSSGGSGVGNNSYMQQNQLMSGMGMPIGLVSPPMTGMSMPLMMNHHMGGGVNNSNNGGIGPINIGLSNMSMSNSIGIKSEFEQSDMDGNAEEDISLSAFV
jgi:hypothetical protein